MGDPRAVELRNSGSLRPCRGAAGLQVGASTRTDSSTQQFKTQRAERSSSGPAPGVTVALWEDEGRQRRRGGAHLISATEDLKPRCCCCWGPERRGQTRIRRGFNDVPLRWDSVSRHSCAPVGNNEPVPPLRPHQGLRGLFRFGTGVL